jgi:hypothetical protein
MANEFFAGRVVRADFTILASTATQALPSGVYIPAGALVTGVTFMDKNANTIANASGTVDLRIGSVAMISTKMIKDLGAQTVAVAASLVSAGGMYVPITGEVKLSVQATSGTAVHTISPSVFIGYVL